MARLLEIGVTNAVIAACLAIAVWAITRQWRQPAFAHLLWVLVLVKLITPPLVPIPWEVQSATTTTEPIVAATAVIPAPTMSPLPTEFVPAQVIESAPIEFVESPAKKPVATIPATTWYVPNIDWTKWLSGLWLAGSAIWLTTAVGRLMRFHLALTGASLLSDELQRMADDVAATLDVSRFRVRVTSGRLSPLVWPIGMPTIVVPQDLLDILTEPELRAILTHEFAHLRRKDHWIRWLEFVATAIYWWDPVVWYVRRQIQQTEEQACDALVIRSNPATAKVYANALFQAVEVATGALRPVPVLASRVTSGGDLKERIEHVMNATCSAEISKWGRRGLWFAALCILPFSLTTVYAEKQQERTPTEEDTAAVPAEPVQGVVPSRSSQSVLQVTKQGPTRHFVGEIAKFRTIVKNTGDSPLTNLEVVDSYDPAYEPRFTDPGREILSDGSFKWTIPRLESGERRTFDVQCACVSPSQNARSRVTVKADDGISNSDEKSVELIRLNVNTPLFVSIPQSPGNDSVTESAENQIPVPPPWPAQEGRPPELWNVTQHVQERQILQPDVDDATVLREQVKFLEEQFKRIDALSKSGALGGTVDSWALSGFELARARGELAFVEGNHTDATTQFAKAEEFAETALKATSAAYLADRVTLDTLMQASKNLTDIRRRSIQVRHTQEASTKGLTADNIEADLRRALAEQSTSESSTPSLAYFRKAMEQQQANVEQLKMLADKQVVSASELARAKTDFELNVEGLRQTQRKLESRRLLVKLAEVEFEQAVEANKQSPSKANELEVRRKKLMIDLAEAKVRELSE